MDSRWQRQQLRGRVNGPSGRIHRLRRFVRAFWFRQFAVHSHAPQQGVQIATHILNQFDIPPGTVMTEAGGTVEGGGVAGRGDHAVA